MGRTVIDRTEESAGGASRASRRDVLRLAIGGGAGIVLTVHMGSHVFATTEGGVSLPANATPEEGTPVGSAGKLTIYCGRNENLVGALIGDFEPDTGVDAEVRYGDTAELAATILDEGKNSPTDLYFSQDAGALGALEKHGLLEQLPDDVLEKVDTRFRSKEGVWIGTSARVRVAVYNTDMIQEADLPSSVLDFVDPKWKGKIGWAPENASFQAFVTCLRKTKGEDAARAWLEDMQKNEPKVFQDNGSITRAVGAGEFPVGLVNHYYMYEVQAEDQKTLPLANHYFAPGDPGTLINVAGIAVLKTAKNKDQAFTFARFLLGDEAQKFFAEHTFEYPIIPTIPPSKDLKPLAEIRSPDVDLSDLDDLEGTIALLTDLGIL
ncbi:MAG: iron ABC transporter substrate-binding protein [Thermomicrobiales bacterium]